MTSIPSVPEPDTADRTDRLILQMARDEVGWDGRGTTVVIDDETGALTCAALAAAGESGRVRAWSASHRAAGGLVTAHPSALDEGRLTVAGMRGAPADLGEVCRTDRGGGDAPVVALMRLPTSLGALERAAADVAGLGAGAAIVAGGRVKHMTRSQNEVLARWFRAVHATRGAGSSRCLVAAEPTASGDAPRPSATRSVPVGGEQRPIPLTAVGGVFGRSRADAGSMLLLGALDAALVAGDVTGPAAAIRDAADLGSGNGLLAAYLALALPEARLLASDDDLDAVAATRAALDALAIGPERARVTWDTSLSEEHDDSADLVVLNPPFHAGTAIDATLVHDLLDASARVLRPGGELWFVHNSHLRYRAEVEARVGPARQMARDRRFTVLRAVRAGA